MAFSIKQLLFCIAVVAFGLMAMFSVSKPDLGTLFDLLTLGILIGMAYGAWLSTGESRAFRVGFLGWALLYFFLFVKKFDVGIYDLADLAYRATVPPAFLPSTPRGGFDPGFGYSNYYRVFHCLFLLLLGLVGGWVTVYFYRKRQRMLGQSQR